MSNEERKTVIDENVKEFTEIWKQMLYVATEAEYEQSWLTTQEKYRDSQPQILSYLIRQ